MTREDPSLVVTQNEDTGQLLLRCVGCLSLYASLRVIRCYEVCAIHCSDRLSLFSAGAHCSVTIFLYSSHPPSPLGLLTLTHIHTIHAHTSIHPPSQRHGGAAFRHCG